eukprot:SRR837773.22241.p1 GENE.SRR837773.22241~~SRR837773.22241.p1  ORF type:complete len:138 (-),score=51.55 SRR837773.22241:116-529(-)
MARAVAMSVLFLAVGPLAALAVPAALGSLDLSGDDVDAPALSLLQGHATKIVKRRASDAASGATARQAAARAAMAFDDDLDLGGVALIQEKQAIIKAGRSTCDSPAAKPHLSPPLGGAEAALMAAAADGVEDGLAAL